MFKSFFFAGFECATGWNAGGEWIDQICATQHDRFVEQDYRLLQRAGLLAAREGIRWPLVDRNGRYDFDTIRPMLEAAQRTGIDVIWDLFHYGYPSDVDLFSDAFPQRFAEYCHAAATYVGRRTEGACYFTPVNEPSYFSWAAGEAGVFAPHCKGRGSELKVRLVEAALRGTEAIWAACDRAQIIQADPVCRVVTPRDRPELASRVEHFNEKAVFESFDILCGRVRPELGGSRRHLGVVGVNYYWTNQWELTREGVPLADDDPRRVPLRELVRDVWRRYGGDLLIMETAHRDEMRSVWLRELAEECEALLDAGVPLRGVCLYPILGMPEWHAQDEWTRMGLWDLVPQSPDLGRIPCRDALAALAEARRLEQRHGPLRTSRRPTRK